MRKKYWLFIAVFIVMGLVAFRLYLPTLIKNKANEKLDKIPGYRGHIDDVDIHLWRGAYSIIGLSLLKIDGDVPVPFVNIRAIDFSIAWKPLFHGNLSCKVELDAPKINFVTGGTAAQQQTSIDKSWQDQVKDLLPLRVARLGIKNGEIHFRNYHSEPPFDIFIHRIFIVATNLTNSLKFTQTLKATIEGDALAMSSGALHLFMTADPLGAAPTFKIKVELKHLALPELNDFFKQYLAVNMKTGTLSVYVEGAADNGKFLGYAQPLLDHVDLVKIKTNGSLGEALKGFAVKMVSYLLKNHPENRLATRIEIKGDIADLKTNVWVAVASFLHNWLIKAIDPGFTDPKPITLKDAKKQRFPN